MITTKPQDWGREEGDAFNWAIISHDTLYRYVLARAWDVMLPTMVWVMLNPSTADATTDDPTIRKCIGFAKRHRCGGIVVVNLFAYRTTNPQLLRIPGDPVGPHNADALRWALAFPETSVLVAGWGRLPRKPEASAQNQIDLREVCGAFGTTQNEPHEPRHPLMLPYATPLLKAGEW